MYLPEQEKKETSVHVLFDERIPSKSEEYFEEIDRLRVKVNKEKWTLEEFGCLKDTYHMDSGLLNRTNRVLVCKGESHGYLPVSRNREKIWYERQGANSCGQY